MFYSNAPFLTYSTCSYTVTLKPELTSLKVIRTDTYRSATYDFLLTFHSNHGSISYCFRDRRRFQSKLAKKIHPRVTYAYWTANGDVCKLVLGGQPHTHTHTPRSSSPTTERPPRANIDPIGHRPPALFTVRRSVFQLAPVANRYVPYTGATQQHCSSLFVPGPTYLRFNDD